MENKYTRREALGLVGAGAVVLGASGLANSATIVNVINKLT